jgi:hypothetical protein
VEDHKKWYVNIVSHKEKLNNDFYVKTDKLYYRRWKVDDRWKALRLK